MGRLLSVNFLHSVNIDKTQRKDCSKQCLLILKLVYKYYESHSIYLLSQISHYPPPSPKMSLLSSYVIQLLSSYALLSCYLPILYSYVILLCSSILLSSYAIQLCYPHMLFYLVTFLCYTVMLSSHALLSCYLFKLPHQLLPCYFILSF